MWNDERIPIVIAATVAVAIFSVVRYRREKARLHQERGYNAHDPSIDKEAWQSTRATLRGATAKGRLVMDVVKGVTLAPP